MIKQTSKMITYSRLYHTSAVAFSMKKLGIKLNKMVHPKTKRNWFPSQTELELLPSVKSLGKTQNEPGKRASKRTAMLNKLFMKHITDIMSTGTVAIDVVGKGIEVSRVKIAPDLQRVNVFWVCKGTASDRETEVLLCNIAGPLRHELSTLRVMGEVPYIEFVKDMQEARIADIDQRLAVADFGEDYTPTDLGELLKSEFILNSKLSSEMQAKISQLEEQSPPNEEPVPPMTHNMYGLEHDRIMNRLLAARKKSKDAWSKIDDTVISYRVEGSKPDAVDLGTQKKELTEFLLKRKILQNKIQKELRRNDDWQLGSDQTNDDYDDDVYDDDIDDFDQDDDYIYTHDLKNQDDSRRSS